MTEVSLNEDSFSSWHTCPEDSRLNKLSNENLKQSKTNNENILKDLNLNLENSDDDESIVEFEKIVDQSDAFNKFKEFKESVHTEDFLRPVTPSGSIRRENSPSVYPNLVRPKYLNEQQNVSLADKTTPANNIHTKVTETTTTEVPNIKVNNEKATNLLSVPNVSSYISPLNQSSALTLIGEDNQEYDITMPGGSLAIFDDSKNDFKNEIHNIKEDIKDKKDDIKDTLKEKKENLKDDIKNTKEKISENVNEAKEKVQSNGDVDDNQGTLGRLFSYFRGFGNNESANNEKLTNEDKPKTEVKPKIELTPVTDNKNKNQKTLIETVEALGSSPYSEYTNTPALFPTESVVTVVNDSEDDYDDDDEFVNALDSAPEDDINYKQHNYANTKVSTTVTLNNPTDISIYGNEAVVEETVVIQNPDGTETIAKKIIYAVDENGNKIPIQTVVYNNDDDDLIQNQLNNNAVLLNQYAGYNNQNYNNPNATYNNQSYNDSHVVNSNQVNQPNKVVATAPAEEIDESDMSYANSEDFVDAITASRHNTLTHDDVQRIQNNVPPMALSFREGTVKKIQHNHLEKKASSHTLKSTTSVNVELVPVNKQHETVDVTETRPNYFGYYEENSSNTITSEPTVKPPRKAHRKKSKQKKRKWYHKVFKFSICTRHEDY